MTEWIKDTLWKEEMGTYICQCQCGTTLYQKDLQILSTKKKEELCSSCQSILEGGQENNGPFIPVTEISVANELGFCGCGSYERVGEMMLNYLRFAKRKDFLTPWDYDGMDNDALTLIAYLASKEGWTDHGTSLPYAWLTERGKAVLERLEILCKKESLS